MNRFEKIFFYALALILYLMVPFCIMGVLGAALTQKYDVEHGRFFVEMDNTLTKSQKTIKLEELHQLSKKMGNATFLLFIIGIASFCSATGLLLKRGSLLNKKEIKT